jgi:hypothetical protein
MEPCNAWIITMRMLLKNSVYLCLRNYRHLVETSLSVAEVAKVWGAVGPLVGGTCLYEGYIYFERNAGAR